MATSDTPASTGTAMSVDDATDAITSILTPPDEEPETGEGTEDQADSATEQPDASDQVSDDETEGDDAQDESDTDTSDEAEDEEPKVRLSDGTEATLSEVEDWRKGTLRQADYTRKTQELAEQRKTLETRQAELAQKSETVDQNLNFAIEVAKANLPQKPDVALAQSDPIAFSQQKAEYDARAEQLQQLMTAKQQHDNEASQQQQQAFKEWANNERAQLVEAMPELRDAAKAREFNTDLAQAIQKYGFTPEELGKVYDHRFIKMGKDLVAYQKMMANKPKADAKAKKAPPVQKPGKRSGSNEKKKRESKDKMDRLRETGRKEDAVNVIMDMI